jgi:hypothetical protein
MSSCTSESRTPPISSNFPSDDMTTEQGILRVAHDYEQEGYTVVVGPRRDQLPAFAADHAVDILATKGNEGVLVVVGRTRREVSDRPKSLDLADITNRQPGWRFDLVVLEPEPAGMRSVRGAAEPTPDDIERKLFEAEQLLQGDATMTACMVAWAAFEASMRRVLGERYGAMPNVLLRSLYASGNFSREEFSRLDEAFQLRTQIVHGFVPANLDPRLVTEIIRAARHLLAEEMTPEPAVS